MAQSLRQRLISGGAWVVAGKIVVTGSNLLATLLLARLLTQDEVGVYGLAFSLVTVAAMAGQLGLHQAAVRVVAEAAGTASPGRARGAIGRIFGLVTLGNAVVAALLLAGAGGAIAERWSSPMLAAALGPVVLWSVLQSFQVLISESFRGYQDLRRATLYGGAVFGLVNLGALAAVRLAGGRLTVSGAIVIAIVATAASVAGGAGALRWRVVTDPVGDPPGRGELLRIGLPLWVSGLTGFALAQVDLWALGAFASKGDVGAYYVAARLVNLVSMSLLLVNLVVPPFVAELYARGERARLERLLRATATVAGLPALGVLLAFVLAGGPILGLFGPEYREAAAALALLSLGKLVNVWTGSCGVTMGMTGHQTTLMTITIVSSAITAAGCFAFVRPFGMIGVAGSVCGGTVIQNVALWIATRIKTGMWTHVAWVGPREIRALLGSLWRSRGRSL